MSRRTILDVTLFNRTIEVERLRQVVDGSVENQLFITYSTPMDTTEETD